MPVRKYESREQKQVSTRGWVSKPNPVCFKLRTELVCKTPPCLQETVESHCLQIQGGAPTPVWGDGGREHPG